MDVDLIVHTTQQNTAKLNQALQSAGIHLYKQKIENGMHANSAGYRVMSEEIVRALFPCPERPG